MNVTLTISRDMTLPADAVTQKMAFIGRTGSGKTHGAGKVVEEFLQHKIPVVVIDPVGNWYGLRTSANGKGPGFSIPIFGGEHGDVPLTPTAGALIANLIVDRGISAVIDVSHFRKNEVKQFVTDFAEQLFHRKKKDRTPLHLVLEEAQRFMPQKTFAGEERMLGAMEDIAKLGRNYGIGLTIITQRPQAVHKECLNQTEALFVFQTNGPHERKAIEGWIMEKGLEKGSSELSTLEVGTCWLWSPQWLKVYKKIKILPKKTFDTSQTPKLGQRVLARELAPVDLEKISADMQSVIEKHQSNDPAFLHKKIAELQRQLNAKNQGKSAVDSEEHKKLKQDLRDLQVKYNKQATVIQQLFDIKLPKAIQVLQNIIDGKDQDLTKQISVVSTVASVATPASGSKAISTPPVARDYTTPVSKRKSTDSAPDNGEVKLGKCERAILTVLAQRTPLGKQTTRTQMGILSGYTPSSGSFGNSIGKLRTAGYVTHGDPMTITQAGIDALGQYQPLPTGEELQAYWYSKLGKCERLILQELVKVYPNSLTREELGPLTGYTASSGSFGNSLGKLKTLELAEQNREKEVKASAELFED